MATFQSTPGSEEPGDRVPPGFGNRPTVSIHARLRGAGRRWDHAGPCAVHRFQSTPGSEEPGDVSDGPRPRLPGCFNPRPAPRSRATSTVAVRNGKRGCFNPRPAPRSRATGEFPCVDVVSVVSIHARLRGAGRLAYRTRLRCTSRFNPRPAPRSRATEQFLHRRSHGDGFNPRPAPRSRATRPRRRRSNRPRSFNPRPAPRSRAT